MLLPEDSFHHIEIPTCNCVQLYGSIGPNEPRHELILTIQIMDTQTNFFSTADIQNDTVDNIWTIVNNFWASIYTGYQNKSRAAQCYVFKSPRFIEVASAIGVKAALFRVEDHNVLGAVEKYHGPLRSIYLQIRFCFRKLPIDPVFSLSMRARNDAMNVAGIVSSVLVFCVLPRFPSVDYKNSDQQEGMNALLLASHEIESMVSK